MPIADKVSPAPGEVRLAGAISLLPGLAALTLAVIFALREANDTAPSPTNGYAEAGFYLLIAASTFVCAGGLLMGKTWARSPTVVVALLMMGVGWYAAAPSDQPAIGVPIILLGVLVLVLLFRRPARAWVLGQEEGETEREAAERGGAAGRARHRRPDDSE